MGVAPKHCFHRILERWGRGPLKKKKGKKKDVKIIFLIKLERKRRIKKSLIPYIPYFSDQIGEKKG